MHFKIGKFILDFEKMNSLFKNKKTTIQNYFSKEEIKKSILLPLEKQPLFFGKIYSSKKSLEKALNLKKIDYSEICLDRKNSGAPFLNFLEKKQFLQDHNLKNDFKTFLSFSHEEKILVSFVLIQFKIKI